LNPLTHHPPETLLLAYAAGSLREPQARAVATHLAFCPGCRQEAKRLDELGGALLDEMPPEPLPADALDCLLARLDEEPEPRAAKPECPPCRGNVLGTLEVPQPLRGYLEEVGEKGTWIELADGVTSLRLPVGEAPVVAEILKMAPGSTLPAHRHSDQELILILDGAFTEQCGQHADPGGKYAEGDLGEFEAESIHTVMAGPDGCICYRVLAGPVERLSTAVRPHGTSQQAP
jgi:putative transcriptional regulator